MDDQPFLPADQDKEEMAANDVRLHIRPLLHGVSEFRETDKTPGAGKISNNVNFHPDSLPWSVMLLIFIAATEYFCEKTANYSAQTNFSYAIVPLIGRCLTGSGIFAIGNAALHK